MKEHDVEVADISIHPARRPPTTRSPGEGPHRREARQFRAGGGAGDSTDPDVIAADD